MVLQVVMDEEPAAETRLELLFVICATWSSSEADMTVLDKKTKPKTKNQTNSWLSCGFLHWYIRGAELVMTYICEF